MVMAITPDEEYRYILECDRDLPPEKQTVFILRPLSYSEYTQIEDNVIESVSEVRRGYRQKKNDEFKMRILSGSQEKRILCSGIKRIENFKDKNGNEIIWDFHAKDNEKMKILSMLRPANRRELANAITEASYLDEDEQGN